MVKKWRTFKFRVCDILGEECCRSENTLISDKFLSSGDCETCDIYIEWKNERGTENPDRKGEVVGRSAKREAKAGALEEGI